MTAKEAQEWLTLNGYAVVIDNEWGPASTAALKRFQVAHGLTATGVVDDASAIALATPIRICTEPLEAHGAPLGVLVVNYAKRYLTHKAREVGGDNRGPWVRLFMHGQDQSQHWPDGSVKNSPWCAGYATSVVGQAAATLDVPSPVHYNVGCDAIATDAKTRGRLTSDFKLAKPGDLFLVPRDVKDYTRGFQHVGIVAEIFPDNFQSNEGNSNTDGSRNGIEVASTTRAWRNLWYVLVNGGGTIT